MSDFDPTDPKQQSSYFRRHPLVTNDYNILTPSMPQVLENILDAVMLHKKSLIYSAAPQMGKTKICNFVVAAVQKHVDFRDRFVIHVTADPRISGHKVNESIIRIIARSMNLRIPERPDSNRVRVLVLDAIESRLRGLGGRHLVIFIDELQALKMEDFENLQFLQNELGLHNIAVTLIGFSQTQIEHTITLLRAEGRPELIVRFLNEQYDLPRCTDHAWMSETLSMYDAIFTYPLGSECSYTQFFLPNAFTAGFRMTSYAVEIYQIMEEAAKNADLENLPTVSIFEVFRLILIRSRKYDAPDFVLTEDVIKSATKESQLHNYANNMHESAVKNESNK